MLTLFHNNGWCVALLSINATLVTARTLPLPSWWQMLLQGKGWGEVLLPAWPLLGELVEGVGSPGWPHLSKLLLSEPAGSQPAEQWDPLCLEVINYAIWQGKATRLIAEGAADRWS